MLFLETLPKNSLFMGKIRPRAAEMSATETHMTAEQKQKRKNFYKNYTCLLSDKQSLAVLSVQNSGLILPADEDSWQGGTAKNSTIYAAVMYPMQA